MSTPVVKMEAAIESRFENSTREELLAYCAQLGIDNARPGDPIPTLKNLLFAALGMDIRATGPGGASGSSIPRVYRSSLLPPVNLTPSGLWGGRRRRVRVPRPSTATKSENAMPIGWNGKATYWLPFDEPVDLPWPIYQRLLQKKIRRPVQKSIDGPDGTKEITTDWKFDAFLFQDMGDTPGTENLPTSMTQWYQDKGPEFFRKLSDRDIVTVCGRLEIDIIGHDKKRMSRGEIDDAVSVFLFSVSADSLEIDGGPEPEPNQQPETATA